jgi:hypothetical protein
MVKIKIYNLIYSKLALLNKKYSDLSRLKQQNTSSNTNTTTTVTANNSNSVRTSLIVSKTKNNLETVKSAVPSASINTPQSNSLNKQPTLTKFQDNSKYANNAAIALKQNNVTSTKEGDLSKRKNFKTGSIEIENLKILAGVKNITFPKSNPSVKSVSKRK